LYIIIARKNDARFSTCTLFLFRYKDSKSLLKREIKINKFVKANWPFIYKKNSNVYSIFGGEIVMYNSNLLEDWIKDFYYSIDIYIILNQLDLLDIADRLGLYNPLREVF
jgi:hypothetical protein